MKKLIIALTALCIVVLFTCKKSATTMTFTLTGKWNLVSDSLSNGIGPNVTQKYYTGGAGDYFDFRTDNKLYLKEGSTLDTLAYSLPSDSTVVISSFGITFNGVPETNNLKVLANTGTISTPFVVNPGGYYRRVVHLTR